MPEVTLGNDKAISYSVHVQAKVVQLYMAWTSRIRGQLVQEPQVIKWLVDRATFTLVCRYISVLFP